MAGKNRMNGELLYTRNPRHSRLAWFLFYVLLLVGLLVGLYLATAHIRTHTLPVGEIQLSVPYSKYVVGETVTFTLKNNFNSAIYVVNNCPAEPLEVYRQEGNAWVRIHDRAPSDTCSDEQRQVSVPALGSTNGNFAAWPHLFDKPGKYRIVAYIENYAALPYQDFTVIAKPAPVKIQSTPIQITNPAHTNTTTTLPTSPTPTSPTPTRTFNDNESNNNEPNDN